MIEKPVTFLNEKKERLWGVLTLPRGNKKVPAVISVHGFAKTKSERKFVELARNLAKNGVASLRFDFSGCGDSEGKFEEMRISKQVEELNAAFQRLIKEKRIDKERIGVFSHSLGTVIAVLFQKKYERAKCLVLTALALDQKRLIGEWYTPSQIENWERQGYLDTEKFRIGIGYLREAKDYTGILSEIKIPTLVLHGKRDEDIPKKITREAFSKIGAKEKKMIIIGEADHHFEDYFGKKELAESALEWFLKHL
ncbi:MAG: alpha/beta hydrolase [Candidatus Paceibacterales bacterium]